MKDVKIYEEFITQDLINEKFKILSKRLKQKASEYFNPDYIFGSDEYKEILQLGTSIVPLIVEDFLENRTFIWINTLYDLIGITPYINPKTSKDFIDGVYNWCKNDYNEWLMNQ